MGTQGEGLDQRNQAKAHQARLAGIQLSEQAIHEVEYLRWHCSGNGTC